MDEKLKFLIVVCFFIIGFVIGGITFNDYKYDICSQINDSTSNCINDDGEWAEYSDYSFNTCYFGFNVIFGLIMAGISFAVLTIIEHMFGL